MSELKPCPFCGGEALIRQDSYGTTAHNSALIGFVIRCRNCKATAPGAYGNISMNLDDSGELNIWQDDRQKAIEAWNRRVDDGDPD